MYIEAVAMLPHIYVRETGCRGKWDGRGNDWSHYVCLGVSRVFELIFWVNSFRELANETGGKAPGYIVLLSQLAHLVIMADFFYYYFISISKGAPMELPQVM